MSVRANIQRMIGQHRESVARLFQMYGIDLPITVQNVVDACMIKGKEFSQLFWSLDTINFTGTKEQKSFFNTPAAPEVKDYTPLLIFSVVSIVILAVIAVVTRKKKNEG
jgi:hypothetical protein